MILPTKYITEKESLLGIGLILINNLHRPQTVTSLWEQIRDDRLIGTYERFVLSLDMLFIIGAIEMSDGIINLVRRGQR